MNCTASGCKQKIYGAAQPHCEKHRELEKRILSFMCLRNKSYLSSNLQFAVDLKTSGLTTKDIGEAKKFTDFDTKKSGWLWETPIGTIYESNGTMFFK